MLSIVVKSMYWFVSAQISIPPAEAAYSPLNILLDSGAVRVLSPEHARF